MMDFSVIKVSGGDVITLLNNLSTNLLVEKNNTITYSCLLTPNGRFMYDFFLIQKDGKYIITNKNFIDGLINYINIFKMGKDIIFEKTDIFVNWNAKYGDFQDPRQQNLGFYSLNKEPSTDSVKYHIHRMKLKIVDGFHDLTQKESIILDFGFDDINAISYTKGCYLGQELIARTHHMGVIRKKVFYFESSTVLPKNADILQNSSKIGKTLGGIKGHYLALIKHEKLHINEPCDIENAKIYMQ